MSFSKHKRRIISDRSGNYVDWLGGEGFRRGKMGRSPALMHEIDRNGLKNIFLTFSLRLRIEQKWLSINRSNAFGIDCSSSC